MTRKPTMLIIMDGWGESPKKENNAVALANTPNWDALTSEYPYVQLKASGEDVGLPAGLMGNSEVGHLNLGAGRVVYQEITRISKNIRDGDFFGNKVLLGAFESARKTGGAVHLMGLVSDGGVHSAPEHYYALLKLAAGEGFPGDRLFVHCYMDGRDTPPTSGAGHVAELVGEMREAGVGEIATISGRYWAMDRDKRWERVEKAYRCLVYGEGVKEKDPVEAVRNAYSRDETDEFIKPVKIVNGRGEPKGLVRSGDSVIFFNFRGDRPRELSHVFVDEAFGEFDRGAKMDLYYATMTEYEKDLNVRVAFPPQKLTNILADAAAARGLTQFRTAETEKYAHVTFFFNGGVEQPWPGEERLLVPSPRVATYDLQPEMSEPEVAKNAVEHILSGAHDLIVLNFANGDMVGHTGILNAAVKAVEAVDDGVGKVVDAVLKMDGRVLITADHGNCEEMWDEENDQPHTAHTTNPVPCVLAGAGMQGRKLRSDGRLADIAPTLLDLMDIEPADEMTGASLLSG
ncbi:MAG: 2,3-bisphosphoglycerate-independent phosphoglycerate mutase [Planctomycetes bacterium]|nr:2,3-bisphosphoglycerate-independent phosphoglycerate mutase [Planctomycetota bacterium]